MKTFTMSGILGAGIFLQGRGMAVVSRLSDGIDHEYYRGRDGNNGGDVFQHPVRNVERKNIRGSTAHVTNVYRNYAARNNLKRAAVRCTDSSMNA